MKTLILLVAIPITLALHVPMSTHNPTPYPETTPATPTVRPALDPLAFLVGGMWIGTFQPTEGESIKLARRYTWTFDERMIRGQSFRYEGETRVQTRETYFAWSGEQNRIIFWDFLDSGGYGQGVVEARNDTLYMEATIVGSDHPDWRLYLLRDGEDRHTITVEIPEDGQWVEVGRFRYERKR